MNWSIVLLLSGFGLAMGAASVLGLTTGIELWLWLAIGVVCVTVLLRRVHRKVGLHGFLVGLIGGGIAPVVQFIMFPVYLANNPQLEGDFAQVPGGLEPRYLVLLLAPVAGLVSGAVLGAASWLVGRFVARKNGAAQRSDAATATTPRR
jgi:hypothetical protein